MLENSFLLGVDPLFIPQDGFLEGRANQGDVCKENKYELIFDSKVDSKE